MAAGTAVALCVLCACSQEPEETTSEAVASEAAMEEVSVEPTYLASDTEEVQLYSLIPSDEACIQQTAGAAETGGENPDAPDSAAPTMAEVGAADAGTRVVSDSSERLTVAETVSAAARRTFSESSHVDATAATLSASVTMPRGTVVMRSGVTAEITVDGSAVSLAEIAYDGTVYYVPADALVTSLKKAVREETGYLRTTATVYAHETGAQIASLAPKGTKVRITGFDALYSDGSVNKYQVVFSDAQGETVLGYVFAKYVVASEEEALARFGEGTEASASEATGAETEASADGATGAGANASDGTGAAEGETSSAEAQAEAEAGAKTENASVPAYTNEILAQLYAADSTLDFYPRVTPNLRTGELCTEARAIYMNAEALENSDIYAELARQSGANVAVCDIKGENAQLSYASPVAYEQCPTAYAGATLTVEECRAAVQELKSAGLYVVGRIACFQDAAFAADCPDACISSGLSSDGWVSAYSRKAWFYNVSLALEAVRLMGFDEIQFDAVCLPPNCTELEAAHDTDFKNEYGETKSQVIQNFLLYATDLVHEAGAYVSATASTGCATAVIAENGQCWCAISNVVDVVSGQCQLEELLACAAAEAGEGTLPYANGSAAELASEATQRWASAIATLQANIPTPALARSWITGNDIQWNGIFATCDETLQRAQVDALSAAGLSGGFIPWNQDSNPEAYLRYASIWNAPTAE